MSTRTKRVIDAHLAGDPQAQSKSDLLKVLSAMEKALCRQHIMWPHDGKLPCELHQACAKSHLCNEMAEEVMDFSKQLDAASED
ncbi:MAG: hypothetical protein HQ513_18800 [Rhodospirillales bacterium]|nr:hypothetical protein [Rhodospirillales bacterium]